MFFIAHNKNSFYYLLQLLSCHRFAHWGSDGNWNWYVQSIPPDIGRRAVKNIRSSTYFFVITSSFLFMIKRVFDSDQPDGNLEKLYRQKTVELLHRDG